MNALNRINYSGILLMVEVSVTHMHYLVHTCMVPFTENPQFHAHKVVKVLLSLIASDIMDTPSSPMDRKLLQSGVYHQCLPDVFSTYSKIKLHIQNQT